jgi:catechol 2,3-dioxygenase-like lactoylglutathione lyase family enzyme
MNRLRNKMFALDFATQAQEMKAIGGSLHYTLSRVCAVIGPLRQEDSRDPSGAAPAASTSSSSGTGRVTRLGDQRVEIAMMRTPDGHGRLELSRFLEPDVVADHRTAPVNALGYLRVMFAVDDLDETLARVREHGAELVSTEVVQYEDAYRLCYIRGPEGLLIGLAQELADG